MLVDSLTDEQLGQLLAAARLEAEHSPEWSE